MRRFAIPLLVLVGIVLPLAAAPPDTGIGLLVEYYEIDIDDAASALENPSAKAIHETIVAWKEEKKADLVECSFLRSASGIRSKLESRLELIYGTEGDPPEIPNVNNLDKIEAPALRPTNSTFTAFETDYVGFWIECDPVVGQFAPQVVPDPFLAEIPKSTPLVDLNTEASWNVLVEKVSLAVNPAIPQQKPLADKWLPHFSVHDAKGQTTHEPGVPVLFRVARSPRDRDRMILLFLTAWILEE